MLKVRNLTKVYYTGVFHRKETFSLKNVSFDVKRGEIFGIVGESGSGKTSVAKILLRLIKPDQGSIFFDKQNLLTLNGEKLRRFRQRIQAVSQNYESALNPRMKVKESLKEVFLVKGKKYFKEITTKSLVARLDEVGLKEEHLDRYPAQLSGGQLQRVNIARVMALEPELIIADEATSNLDVSVQAQIIHLMLDLKKKTNSTIIFISHKLKEVKLYIIIRKNNTELKTVELMFVKELGNYNSSFKWEFNKENLARAVYNANIPIISGVGHETDNTIIDFVSDHRCTTPTNAAEYSVRYWQDLDIRINQFESQLFQKVDRRLSYDKLRFNQLINSYGFKRPKDIIVKWTEYLGNLTEKLQVHVFDKVGNITTKLNYGIKQLNAYNPENILNKGYSIVYNIDEKVIKSIKTVKKNDEINVKISDGTINSIVNELKSN